MDVIQFSERIQLFLAKCILGEYNFFQQPPPSMLPKTKNKLGKPFVVRLEHAQKEQVQAVASANDLTVSDIIRLSIRQQLPALRAGKITIKAS